MRSGSPWLNYDIHGDVRVRTNVPHLEIPEYFRVGSIVPDFEIRIVDALDRLDGHKIVRKIGFGVTDYGNGMVCFESDLPFMSLFGARPTIRSLVSGLNGSKTAIDVAVPFFGFNPIRLKVTQMLARMVRLLLAIKLLQKGRPPVYAASASSGGLAVLVFGYSWTGKSTLVSSLLDDGWEYLSDDYTILDREGGAHCYPDEHAPRASRGEVPVLRYLRRLPLDFQAARQNAGRVRGHAKVSTVLLLERGPDAVEYIDPLEAARRVMLINMEELSKNWNSPMTQLIAYYSYLYPEFDLEGLMAQYWTIVASALGRAERCAIVRTRSPGSELARKVAREIMADAGRPDKGRGVPKERP